MNTMKKYDRISHALDRMQKEIATVFNEHQIMRDWILANTSSFNPSLKEDAEHLLAHLNSHKFK